MARTMSTMGTMWLTASLSCLIYLVGDERQRERKRERPKHSVQHLKQLKQPSGEYVGQRNMQVFYINYLSI